MKYLTFYFISYFLLFIDVQGEQNGTDTSISSSSSKLTWDQAYEKAKDIVNRMTVQQKTGIMTGNGGITGPCAGNTFPVEGLFPSLCLQDGPSAVRGTKGITAGVAGINAAASFDKIALRQRGEYLGQEFRGKGVNVYLGPDVNMVRTPYAGRNFETFGEDPYLSGVAGMETILGVQSQGVISQIKHAIANEQETNRRLYSSNLNDKALNEVYLWPFEEAINAGVGSIMCSYNRVNGTHACENNYILREIIKDRLGFRGFITSDWDAAYSTVDNANHGLDMSMPNPDIYGKRLELAINRGQVSIEVLNEMATRIVATWYKFGQDKGYPPVNMNSLHPLKDQHVNVQGNHKTYARSLGAASAILLRNLDDILPLKADKIKSIAVVGTDAGDSLLLGDNICGTFPCLTGTVAMGGGSGSAAYPYLVSPFEGIKKRAGDKIKVTDINSDISLLGINTASTKNYDVAIVFSNVFTTESFDRFNLNLDRNGNNLIKQVADANKNTIVVIHSPSAATMPWIDHPNIKAILWAGYPGQETGNSLADVLFGDVNPSGRLPYTIAKKEEDYPVKVERNSKEIDYTEGVFVGYRYFDQNNIDPLFEFGYGLSYTNFSYADLKLKTSTRRMDDDEKPTHTWSAGSTSLVKASITVKNTGGMDGAEIVQAYIGFPASTGEPPKVLRGFEKVFIKKTGSTTVHFEFGQRELRVWDIDKKGWVLTRGNYTLYIGASSRDIRQTTSFIL
ncbi:glycoside hydrolase superfamily [Halteromyces radiatus]|uniref:glycoside hydrolase superfamily n=1 Tax=Halteromyces radiatus TaxID=101107 RepID=UPI00221E8ACF|nr:glycoside hydrolase superfamily [Halteromyces radiatus]KAI8081440.1 glycoside hydrolase superfamily [Halteromyces radiatus]